MITRLGPGHGRAAATTAGVDPVAAER
jgi:hypothetical protein